MKKKKEIPEFEMSATSIELDPRERIVHLLQLTDEIKEEEERIKARQEHEFRTRKLTPDEIRQFSQEREDLTQRAALVAEELEELHNFMEGAHAIQGTPHSNLQHLIQVFKDKKYKLIQKQKNIELIQDFPIKNDIVKELKHTTFKEIQDALGEFTNARDELFKVYPQFVDDEDNDTLEKSIQPEESISQTLSIIQQGRNLSDTNKEKLLNVFKDAALKLLKEKFNLEYVIQNYKNVNERQIKDAKRNIIPKRRRK